MTTSITSYRPEIKVLIDGADYASSLGDRGAVHLQKSLYAPAGEAHVHFPDMPTYSRDSLYGILKILQPLDIRIRRKPDQDWTTVFRGFVRSIGRDEQVGSDGRVQRSVTVVGHDCGAAFLMQTLGTIVTWQNKDKPLFQSLGWLSSWLTGKELTQKPHKIGDFLWEVATQSTKSIMEKAAFFFQKQFTVDTGYVIPTQVTSLEGPVWSLLSRYSDAPWNEFFVREGRDDPELVFRPTPWLDVDNNPLSGGKTPLALEIALSDILALSAHRDDAELVNHVWVNSPALAGAEYVQMKDLKEGLVTPDTREQFGDRAPQGLATWLGPTEKSPENAPEGEFPEITAKYKEWITERQAWAVKAGSQVHELERGAVTCKGNPTLRVGEYIHVARGPLLDWNGYCVSVSHDFQPFHRYVTTVEYIRGTQWLNRKKIASSNPWDKERATGT